MIDISLGTYREDNTWEPLENLSNCRDLIERFEAKQQLKAQKKRTSKKTGSEKTPQANKKEGNDSSENEPKRAIGTNWSPNFEEVAGSGVCSQEDMDTYCYVSIVHFFNINIFFLSLSSIFCELCYELKIGTFTGPDLSKSLEGVRGTPLHTRLCRSRRCKTTFGSPQAVLSRRTS